MKNVNNYNNNTQDMYQDSIHKMLIFIEFDRSGEDCINNALLLNKTGFYMLIYCITNIIKLNGDQL